MSARLEWNWSDVLDVTGQSCMLCQMAGRSIPATTLAVVVGFESSGGGSATLQPLCDECCAQRNVVACCGIGDPAEVAS